MCVPDYIHLRVQRHASFLPLSEAPNGHTSALFALSCAGTQRFHTYVGIVLHVLFHSIPGVQMAANLPARGVRGGCRGRRSEY